jgi:uncharacterized protein (DUF4415 family)
MSRSRSRTEAKSLAQMIEGLDALDIDFEILKRTRDIVPGGWGIAHAVTPCAPQKVKMTIRLDREVFDWYRGLGFGYQKRMNEVLRCYMHAIISKHIRQPGDTDWNGDLV